MTENLEASFKKILLGHLEGHQLEGDIGTFLDFQESGALVKGLIDSYGTISEFMEILHQTSEPEKLKEIICQDMTFSFAIVGEIKKVKLQTHPAPTVDHSHLTCHLDSLDMLLNMVHQYYSLKSKLKYNALINALYLSGKETLEQFKEKIDENHSSGAVSFPNLIKQNLQKVEHVLSLPQSLKLNSPHQYLKYIRCLLATRKAFLDYALAAFFVLEQIDHRAGNQQIGLYCSTRFFLLFSPFLGRIEEQIKQLKIDHRQKLRNSYGSKNAETEIKLKTWFDVLDIHFESNPQIRKLKLHINTLEAEELQSWVTTMSQPFQDFPAVLKEIEEIKKAPLDYQAIHNFAITAFQDSPKLQQQIINGMKIIENMQGRFNNWIHAMQIKLGGHHSLKFTDIYDLFHTLQEGRERGNLIQDGEASFSRPGSNPTNEIKRFIQLSNEKKEIFLEMVLTATQKKSYIQSIALQFYHLKQPKLFANTLSFFFNRKSQSKQIQTIFSAFSEVKQQMEEIEKQKKKKVQFEKNIAHLNQVKAVSGTKQVIFSEAYFQRKEAQKKLERQKDEYKWVKRLTSRDLEDYLNERRMKLQMYLSNLRAKRMDMNEKQREVSESTEMFVEAAMDINDCIQSAQNASEEATALNQSDIDKFERDTLEALQHYENTCSAQGNNKKEYFKNRQNEIKGILQSLREQSADNTLDGGEMVHITDSVHDIMGDVEKTMQDLSGELPEDAEEKLKIILQQEERSFNDLMEKEFSFTARGKEAHYQLKFFIMLPIPAKQKLLALQQFDFGGDDNMPPQALKTIEHFLHSRSSFTSTNPFDVVQDNSIQLIKLWNYLWYEELLYKTIPFGFTEDSETITLLNLYALPLKAERESKFTQHTQLIERILQEIGSKNEEEELYERIERDIKHKNFLQNVNHHFQYKEHETTYDLFPGGQLDLTTFETVKGWYGIRKEDQKINYYKLNRGD